jgi:hypothetical protein
LNENIAIVLGGTKVDMKKRQVKANLRTTLVKHTFAVFRVGAGLMLFSSPFYSLTRYIALLGLADA